MKIVNGSISKLVRERICELIGNHWLHVDTKRHNISISDELEVSQEIPNFENKDGKSLPSYFHSQSSVWTEEKLNVVLAGIPEEKEERSLTHVTNEEDGEPITEKDWKNIKIILKFWMSPSKNNNPNNLNIRNNNNNNISVALEVNTTQNKKS